MVPGFTNFVAFIISTAFMLYVKRLEHPAIKWNHSRADKMLDILRFRASNNPKPLTLLGPML
jgi:hypothetical protein